MATRKPKSPIDDIAKYLSKKGISLSKKEILDMKRYARGIGRTDYLDRRPPVKPNLKTKAQKKVAPRLEMIEFRRQDKAARVYGDNNGPHDYFWGKYGDVQGKDKKAWNKAFAAESKIGASNARTAAKNVAKSKPVKKTATKKAVVKKTPTKMKNK